MKFLIVGTVSNVEQKISEDLRKVLDAFSVYGETQIFLVESDSQDNTLNVLKQLTAQIPGMGFESLGNLRVEIPSRIERIRYCRNYYVKYIRDHFAENDWSHIIVADLDGMNRSLRPSKIRRSLLAADHWDACFATQKLGYYDLYALRARDWVEKDCLDELHAMKLQNPYRTRFKNELINFLISYRHFDRLRKKAIYSKMRVLSGDFQLVDSAFGGLGIYSPEIFLNFDYSPRTDTPKYKCEHLDLHLKCNSAGMKLVIDPKLTNSIWNEHNVRKIWIIRFIGEFRKFLLRS